MGEREEGREEREPGECPAFDHQSVPLNPCIHSLVLVALRQNKTNPPFLLLFSSLPSSLPLLGLYLRLVHGREKRVYHVSTRGDFGLEKTQHFPYCQQRFVVAHPCPVCVCVCVYVCVCVCMRACVRACVCVRECA